MRLTDKIIGKLALPHGKTDCITWDSDLSGFGYRLRASGNKTRKSWVCQYRHGGRTQRCSWPDALTAEQARAAARAILAKVALGQNPQADKAAARLKDAHALKIIVEDYLEARKDELRPASFRVTKLYLSGKVYFGPLHSTPISAITRADVAARITTIKRENGTVTASRARAALSSMFVWAMGEGLAEANPVIGTNRPADPAPRDRVLSDDELAAVWKASGDDEFGKVVKLLVLTAGRRAEVAGMRWSEIDRERGVWTLPRERAKNNHELALPLPPAALALIDTVPEIVGRDQLFGTRAEAGFTRWGISKSALDARLADKVKPWRLHDIRRTAATRMADLGTQPHVVECILGHYGGFRSGVASVYNRSPYFNEMRTALALWADHVTSLIDGTGKKVVLLHKARESA